MKFVFFTIRSKKAHGFFAKPNFDAECCVVLSFILGFSITQKN